MGSLSLPQPDGHVNGKFWFPAEANDVEYAKWLDQRDPLRHFREQFIIPSTSDLKRKQLAANDENPEQGVYLCGNSLGLQPRAVAKYLEAHLNTWSTIGVLGHAVQLENTPLKPWANMAEYAAEQSARLVGASPEEVTIMNTLTVNLHLLMASFYKPTATKYKIVLDWKAFPSDHYAIESHISWHGYDPKEAMILVSPDDDYRISTEKTLSVIDAHKDEIALILLPGLQYYSGQVLDMAKITKHARSQGLIIGWDLAHAAGNVSLDLHDWDVDFAAWCTYKYMNAGPGAIGGVFIHERHGKVDNTNVKPQFKNRLTGWYGGDPAVRFQMDNKFKPIPGAAGWQLSNPSAIDLTSVCASLSVFNQTSMLALREKSLLITGYLEHLLLELRESTAVIEDGERKPLFRIITPSEPSERGAQLSLLLLRKGLLDAVIVTMQERGIVIDKRQPDVVRVAPVPLYSSFLDVWRFVKGFGDALVGAISSGLSTDAMPVAKQGW